MNEQAKITPTRMAILGAGWFGTFFFWGFHTGSVPLFLNDFTDSKLMISLVLSLAGIANCIVPPIVGYLSDRTSGRFGRRRPYIFFGMAGVSFCLLGLPFLPTFGTVALLCGIMYLSIAVGETPLASLLPDITPSDQRSTVSGVVHLIGSIGLISFFILGAGTWDKNPIAVFRMVAVATLCFPLITVTLVGEARAPRGKTSGTANPLTYLKGVLNETGALTYFIAQFFWSLGFTMVSAFITLFAVEELGAAEGQSLFVPMALTIVSTLFILPLGMLGDRVGRKGLLSFMIAFWAVAGGLIGLSQNLTHAIIGAGITGIPFAASMAVGYAYMLDLIPRERTAEFVGINAVSLSAPMIFGPIFAGRLIDMLGYRWVFPAAAACMIVGLVILQFVHPRRTSEHIGESSDFSQSVAGEDQNMC